MRFVVVLVFFYDYLFSTAGKKIARQEMYFGKQLLLQSRKHQCNVHVLQILFQI